MKRLVLLAMIFVCSLSYGQTFVLTLNGLRDSLNYENDFLVIIIKDKTSKQLYDNAIKFINKNIATPTESIKGNIVNEFVSFKTYIPNFYSTLADTKSMGIKPFECRFDLIYLTELSFKDGKLKYKISDIVLNLTGNKYHIDDIYEDWKFKNNSEMKFFISNFFNKQSIRISNELSENVQSNNW